MMLVASVIAILAFNAFYLVVKVWEDIAHRRWMMAIVGSLSLLGMNGAFAFFFYSALARSTDL